MTYYGVIELIGKIRDKTQAHGNVDESNTYLFWNLILEVANLFNEIFEAEKINITVEGKKVYIGYGDEKIYMSDYVIANNELDLYIIQSASKQGNDTDYVDYLAGKYIRPSFKSAEEVL